MFEYITVVIYIILKCRSADILCRKYNLKVKRDKTLHQKEYLIEKIQFIWWKEKKDSRLARFWSNEFCQYTFINLLSIYISSCENLNTFTFWLVLFACDAINGYYYHRTFCCVIVRLQEAEQEEREKKPCSLALLDHLFMN